MFICRECNTEFAEPLRLAMTGQALCSQGHHMAKDSPIFGIKAGAIVGLICGMCIANSAPRANASWELFSAQTDSAVRWLVWASMILTILIGVGSVVTSLKSSKPKRRLVKIPVAYLLTMPICYLLGFVSVGIAIASLGI